MISFWSSGEFASLLQVLPRVALKSQEAEEGPKLLLGGLFKYKL